MSNASDIFKIYIKYKILLKIFNAIRNIRIQKFACKICFNLTEKETQLVHDEFACMQRALVCSRWSVCKHMRPKRNSVGRWRRVLIDVMSDIRDKRAGAGQI